MLLKIRMFALGEYAQVPNDQQKIALKASSLVLQAVQEDAALKGNILY